MNYHLSNDIPRCIAILILRRSANLQTAIFEPQRNPACGRRWRRRPSPLRQVKSAPQHTWDCPHPPLHRSRSLSCTSSSPSSSDTSFSTAPSTPCSSPPPSPNHLPPHPLALTLYPPISTAPIEATPPISNTSLHSITLYPPIITAPIAAVTHHTPTSASMPTTLAQTLTDLDAVVFYLRAQTPQGSRSSGRVCSPAADSEKKTGSMEASERVKRRGRRRSGQSGRAAGEAGEGRAGGVAAGRTDVGRARCGDERGRKRRR